MREPYFDFEKEQKKVETATPQIYRAIQSKVKRWKECKLIAL
jgi:hypothetical protein